MARVLVVDDEPLIRNSLRRTLEYAGHVVLEASGIDEARGVLGDGPIDLLLCDINLPGGSGLDLVRSISTSRPDTAVIMLTGIDDPAVADEAIGIGAYGYLVKPVERNEVLINVASGLRRRELELAQRTYVAELETKIVDRSMALRDALERLDATETHVREAERDVVDRLVTALTLRSEETGAHILRVGAYAALLADATGAATGGAEEMRLAAMLHDVGKIGIPDAILLKPGQLTKEEFEVIKRHPTLGRTMLQGGKSPVLRLGAEIAFTHHERWDGDGYPQGLAGEEIPVSGRMVAIADVFDALTSDRVYRKAMPLEEAAALIDAEAGRHFDPALLAHFMASIDEVAAIRSAHPDHGVQAA